MSNCAISGRETLRFYENKEVSELLSNLGIRTPLSNAPLIGDILLHG